MKITIEIPKAFEEHFYNDNFAESLTRIQSDIRFHRGGVLSGLYEVELIEMLRKAFNRKKNPLLSAGTKIKFDDDRIAKIVKDFGDYYLDFGNYSYPLSFLIGRTWEVIE